MSLDITSFLVSDREDFTTNAPGLIVRKDQSQMSDNEKTSFKEAINILIKNGVYGSLVTHHRNTSHRMHGGSFGGYIGYERFLPWHRVYLARFGEALRTIDVNLFVPYWRWSTDRQIPDWISDFLPQNIPLPNEIARSVTREPGSHARARDLPSKSSMEEILRKDKWIDFSRRLEGRPFGAHNQVHVWVGGTMLTYYSPADPLFWMHHAEIDRIWEIWRSSHPNSKPDLSGNDAVLDPWNHQAEDVLNTQNLRYSYDSLIL